MARSRKPESGNKDTLKLLAETGRIIINVVPCVCVHVSAFSCVSMKCVRAWLCVCECVCVCVRVCAHHCLSGDLIACLSLAFVISYQVTAEWMMKKTKEREREWMRTIAYHPWSQLQDRYVLLISFLSRAK